MIDYQTVKNNVDRILGMRPPEQVAKAGYDAVMRGKQ